MYHKCVACPKIGVSCAGPNFVAMSAAELLDWCKLRKAHLHLSNAKLAEISGMAKGTIDRLFSGEHFDFKYESIRPLLKALVGGTFGELECPQETAPENLQDYKDEIAALHKRINKMDKKHEEETAYLKKLNTNKVKALSIVSALLAFVFIGIIVYLLIDKANPDWGIFRETFGA